MTSLKALFTFFILSSAIVLAIASFNYSIDPQCFRCEEIDTEKFTLNYYYQMAQKILIYKDTEVVILGSSRGQSTPEAWIEEKTGSRTLNLSSSGAELAVKSVFLNLASENLKIKKVIWIADYFELVSENVDMKMKNTPALRRYLPSGISSTYKIGLLDKLQSLIDHNTTEASLAFLGQAHKKHQSENLPLIDYKKCTNPSFKNHQSQEALLKEVDIIFQNYVSGALKPLQSPKTRSVLANIMNDLVSRGIVVDIVIAPYHPSFMERLKREHPEIYDRHLEWTIFLKSLEQDGIRIADAFGGIPGDDGSPRFWDDGSHFTCYSSMVLLEPILRSPHRLKPQ